MWIVPKTIEHKEATSNNIAELCANNLIHRSKVSTLRAWNRRLKTNSYLTAKLENRIVLSTDFVKNYVKHMNASLELNKAPLDLFLYEAPDYFIHLESWSSWVESKRAEHKKRNTCGNKTLWPTPTVSMENKEAGQSYESLQRRIRLKKQIGIQGVITLDNGEYTGRLNPRWVESLMGLPIGWCMITFKDKNHD